MMTHVGGIVTDFALSFQRVLRTLSWLAYSQVVQVNNTKIIPKTNVAQHNKKINKKQQQPKRNHTKTENENKPKNTILKNI